MDLLGTRVCVETFVQESDAWEYNLYFTHTQGSCLDAPLLEPQTSTHISIIKGLLNPQFLSFKIRTWISTNIIM